MRHRTVDGLKRSLRCACLSLALAAGVAPAAAFAAQPRPPAGKKAPDARAPAKKETMDDDTAVVMLVVLGALVVLGGGGVVAWKLLSASGGGSGKGDGRPPEPILPERKHDWEMRLAEPQEAAMLRGIQAYRDGGHSLYLSHGDALITFYDRRMLVSLHRVTDAFLAAGPAAEADPVGVMRSMLDGFAAAEGPGALHIQKGWYAPPIDGLDAQRFTDLCHDTLTRPQPYIEGTQGSSADEGSGSMTLNVEVGGPLNTLCVDLRRALGPVQQARAAQPGAPLIELLRPVLQAMARGELPGAMWTRGGATPAEIDLVTRVVATSAARAA